MKKIVSLLRGAPFIYPRGETFTYLSKNYSRTLFAIRGFYLMSLMMAIFDSGWWWPHLTVNSFQAPLWPFGSLGYQQLNQLAPWIFLLWIISSFLALMRPQNFAFRISQFAGVFYTFALYNSDGHFGHSRHAFLWASLALVFLKLKNSDRRIEKYYNIQVFWAAQFIVCTFYFMTGLWKIISLGECVINKDLVCELSHKVLTNISAQEFIEYEQFAPLRMFLFDYPWIGFISYMGTIWIHLSSMHFAFRSDIHGLFGALRVIFHLGTFILFGVNFTGMTAAVVVLYLVSPFSYPSSTPIFRQILRLPGLNEFLRMTKKVPNFSAILPAMQKSSPSSYYLMSLFYGSLCYLFAHDTTWAWKNLYKQSQELESIIYFGWQIPLTYLRFIDFNCYGLIFSTFLTAIFPKSKPLKWSVPLFYLSFLGLWNFQFRNPDFDLCFLLILLVVSLIDRTKMDIISRYATWLIGCLIGVLLYSNLLRLIQNNLPESPSISYLLNTMAESFPTAYLALNLSFLLLAGALLIWYHKRPQSSLPILSIYLLVTSQLLFWKDSGGVYLLPFMILFLAALSLSNQSSEVTKKP